MVIVAKAERSQGIGRPWRRASLGAKDNPARRRHRVCRNVSIDFDECRARAGMWPGFSPCLPALFGAWVRGVRVSPFRPASVCKRWPAQTPFAAARPAARTCSGLPHGKGRPRPQARMFGGLRHGRGGMPRVASRAEVALCFGCAQAHRHGAGLAAGFVVGCGYDIKGRSSATIMACRVVSACVRRNRRARCDNRRWMVRPDASRATRVARR